MTPKKKIIIHFTLIPELSWWRSADKKRLMCVIEKKGKTIDNVYTTTEVTLVELGCSEKKYVDFKTFVKQVEDGRLEQVGFTDVDVRSLPIKKIGNLSVQLA